MARPEVGLGERAGVASVVAEGEVKCRFLSLVAGPVPGSSLRRPVAAWRASRWFGLVVRRVGGS